jgi:hypothetical protein
MATSAGWGGNTDEIANFWTADGRQVNYDSTRDSVACRNDLEDLRPCCDASGYYAAPGITIDSVAGGTSTATCTSGGGGSSTPPADDGASASSGTCGSGNDDTGRCRETRTRATLNHSCQPINIF